MTREAYKVKEDVVVRGATILTAGETVYPAAAFDGGKADLASQVFGEPHISVSKDTKGKGRALQIPKSALSTILIEDDD